MSDSFFVCFWLKYSIWSVSQSQIFHVFETHPFCSSVSCVNGRTKARFWLFLKDILFVFWPIIFHLLAGCYSCESFLRASPGKPNRNWCSTTKNWLRRRSRNHSRTGVTSSFVFVILEIFMCVFVQGFSEDVFSQFDPVLGNKVRKTFSLPSNQVLLLKIR